MIIFEELNWSNTFSYGEGNKLKLNEHKLAQIVGENGSGKSSIPLILEEALFNKNDKGIKKADLANRNTNKDSYSIDLKFSINQDVYVVSIKRAKTAKVQLLKNGEDISSHTATNTFKTIQDLINLDFLTFSQLVYQSSDNSLQFLKATPVSRIKLLTTMLGIEGYIEEEDKCKESLKTMNSEISYVKGQIDTMENWIEKYKNEDTTKTVVPPLTVSEPTELQEEIVRDRIELADKKKHNEKVRIAQQKIDNYKEVEKPDLPEPVGNRRSLETRKIEHKTTISNENNMIKKVNSFKDICPTCSSHIESEDKAFIIKQCKYKIDKANEEIKKLDKNLAYHRDYEKAMFEYEKALKARDDFLESQSIVSKGLFPTNILEAEISKKERQVKAILKEISDWREKKNQAASKNAKIDSILEQKKQCTKELKDLRARESGLRVKLSNVEYLRKAFSAKGIIAYKIESRVKELESLTNQYLADLSDGKFLIAFSVGNNKLNIDVFSDSHIVDIQSLSSGEFARVNLAVLLSIRKLMNSLSKTKVNILFLDEVMNTLDDVGREKVVEVLLKEQELNVFIITHAYQHPLLERYYVKKVKGVSQITT